MMRAVAGGVLRVGPARPAQQWQHAVATGRLVAMPMPLNLRYQSVVPVHTVMPVGVPVRQPSVVLGGQAGSKRKGSGMAPRRKRPWSPMEDQLLTRLVNEFEQSAMAGKRAVVTRKWAVIAEKIPWRVGKQCRERWMNYLDPNVRCVACAWRSPAWFLLSQCC
jgi:hypothetical protein